MKEARVALLRSVSPHPTYNVSIYAYSGVVRFITAYLLGGYIFALYDRLVN